MTEPVLATFFSVIFAIITFILVIVFGARRGFIPLIAVYQCLMTLTRTQRAPHEFDYDIELGDMNIDKSGPVAAKDNEGSINDETNDGAFGFNLFGDMSMGESNDNQSNQSHESNQERVIPSYSKNFHKALNTQKGQKGPLKSMKKKSDLNVIFTPSNATFHDISGQPVNLVSTRSDPNVSTKGKFELCDACLYRAIHKDDHPNKICSCLTGDKFS